MIFVEQKFDDSPLGRFLFNLYSGLAQLQSEEQGQKIQNSIIEKHRRGEFPHMSPPGYRNIRRPDGRADIIIEKKNADL